MNVVPGQRVMHQGGHALARDCQVDISARLAADRVRGLRGGPSLSGHSVHTHDEITHQQAGVCRWGISEDRGDGNGLVQVSDLDTDSRVIARVFLLELAERFGGEDGGVGVIQLGPWS